MARPLKLLLLCFQIYSMTLRLSAFFEERIRTIISEYKTAVKSSNRLRRSQRFRKKILQQQQDHPDTRSECCSSPETFHFSFARYRSDLKSFFPLFFFSPSQKKAAVKTQEKVESVSVTKTTSAKVSVPERARRSRSSSSGHSSSEDDSGSKGASSTSGTDIRAPQRSFVTITMDFEPWWWYLDLTFLDLLFFSLKEFLLVLRPQRGSFWSLGILKIK